jgi:hypothetical protein
MSVYLHLRRHGWGEPEHVVVGPFTQLGIDPETGAIHDENGVVVAERGDRDNPTADWYRLADADPHYTFAATISSRMS